MRTEERWGKTFQRNCIIHHFPPRLAKDLFELNLPRNPVEDVSSLFIFGKVKTGKTIRAAQLLVQQRMFDYINNISRTTLFVSFPELFAEIRDTYNNNKLTEKEVLDKYLNVDFLIIDDFLTAKPTDWVMEILYRLINYRYENLKKTIITSNLSLEEIENVLQDQRITSRIDRMCVIEEKQSYKTT